MMKSKLFTALTLAAFVGVAACNDREDTYIDDTDPAVEQPAPAPATDDTWEDDAAQDEMWEDTLPRDDEFDGEYDPALDGDDDFEDDVGNY